MEDAVERLDQLARSVGSCTRCEELVACRLRAVPGGGHPHCAVMIVSLSPDPADEEPGKAAGSTLVESLAPYMPALAEHPDQTYVTTIAKCVARTGCELREPLGSELDACFPYLSTELTITTPHYLLAVGEEAARYLLRKLFRALPYAPGDSLELRMFDNPAFKVVPVATPSELAARGSRERKAYADHLRALTQAIGL